jgi:hypothetical protein
MRIVEQTTNTPVGVMTNETQLKTQLTVEFKYNRTLVSVSHSLASHRHEGDAESDQWMLINTIDFYIVTHKFELVDDVDWQFTLDWYQSHNESLSRESTSHHLWIERENKSFCRYTNNIIVICRKWHGTITSVHVYFSWWISLCIIDMFVRVSSPIDSRRQSRCLMISSLTSRQLVTSSFALFVRVYRQMSLLGLLRRHSQVMSLNDTCSTHHTVDKFKRNAKSNSSVITSIGCFLYVDVLCRLDAIHHWRIEISDTLCLVEHSLNMRVVILDWSWRSMSTVSRHTDSSSSSNFMRSWISRTHAFVMWRTSKQYERLN